MRLLVAAIACVVPWLYGCREPASPVPIAPATAAPPHVAAPVTPASRQTPAAQRTETVVADGRLLVVNGQAEVPRGLFGVHAPPFALTPETISDLGLECIRQIHHGFSARPVVLGKDGQPRAPYKDLAVVIDCQGDRYQPATVLTQPQYEAFFRDLGRKYAEACRAAGYDGYVEFWNEAYLNWAERSRKNYDPRFYDVSLATDEGQVTIKGWSTPLEHLRWRRLWARSAERTVTGPDGQPRTLKAVIHFGVPVPAGLKPGDTFVAKPPADWYWTNRDEQTFTVVEEWHPYDPTSVSWWSGRQNLDFYLWMFTPFAEEVRRAAPGVRIIGGWNFGLSMGDWAIWRELTVPLIDRCIHLLDGISEHHYGVDTRAVTAWYEVLNAYTVPRHGKALRGYNTECGGFVDPAVFGATATSGPADPVAREQAAAAYHLRDILELAAQAPDKVGSRTAHQFTLHSGPAWALRLLRPLRGPMLNLATRDPELFAAGAINGQQVVVVLFNDGRLAKEVSVHLAAPAGATFAAGTAAWLEGVADAVPTTNPASAAPLVRLVERALPAAGPAVAFRQALGAQQALRVVLPLVGTPASQPAVHRRQFFAAQGVLLPVQPGHPLDLSIAVPTERLAAAESARLKLVIEKAQPGETHLAVNGVAVPLPDRSWTFTVPVDKALLRPANTLRFTVAGSGDGYRVDAASIELDGPP